jgi:hypothetical protein
MPSSVLTGRELFKLLGIGDNGSFINTSKITIIADGGPEAPVRVVLEGRLAPGAFDREIFQRFAAAIAESPDRAA